MARKTTSNAVEILRSRYVKDDPERDALVEAERLNAEIARLIYTTRTGDIAICVFSGRRTTCRPVLPHSDFSLSEGQF